MAGYLVWTEFALKEILFLYLNGESREGKGEINTEELKLSYDFFF